MLQRPVAPDTVGLVGAPRSSLTVFVAPAAAGTHDETLPAPSTARNCTSVLPSAETTATDAPDVPADHVVPPSVDVRYS